MIFLCIALGLFVALLALPSVIDLQLRRDPAAAPASRLQWGLWYGLLGGGLQLAGPRPQPFAHLLGRRFYFGRTSAAPQSPAAAAPSTPKPKPTSPTSSIHWAAARRLGALLLAPGLDFAVHLPRILRWRRLSIAGDLHLDDPAATGQAYGLLAALAAVAPPWLRLDLRPAFAGPGPLEANLRLHLRLWYLLWIVIVLASRVSSRWLQQGLRRRWPRRPFAIFL